MSEQPRRRRLRIPVPATPRFVRRLVKKGARQTGQPPGTLTPVAEVPDRTVEMELIEFDRERFASRRVEDVEGLADRREMPPVSWLNVDGVHDVRLLGRIGELFEIHPLILEDIVHTDQRPRVDEHGDGLFVVLRMLTYDAKLGEMADEQVGLLVDIGSVLTFQERPGDVFEPVRQRLREGRGRLRGAGPDYLAYALIDVVVDHYFIVLEQIGTSIEQLEEQILRDPTPTTVQQINHLKREMMLMRRAVWPLREALAALIRDGHPRIADETVPYLRDAYDHVIQVIDAIETYRDLLGTLLDLYLSMLSQRTNEVMRVLTIIATIFIPLTFIAGVYGMNFKHMPELEWGWAYPAVWGVMLSVAAGLLVFFRRRGWF